MYLIIVKKAIVNLELMTSYALIIEKEEVK